jgi:DNA-binding CsgD family transcriptional regulator
MASPEALPIRTARKPSDIDEIEPLTPRQLECLRWVREGKTAWETGQIMGIGQRTVESYLAIAFSKLKVRTRVQAVLRAQELGLF